MTYKSSKEDYIKLFERICILFRPDISDEQARLYAEKHFIPMMHDSMSCMDVFRTAENAKYLLGAKTQNNMKQTFEQWESKQIPNLVDRYGNGRVSNLELANALKIAQEEAWNAAASQSANCEPKHELCFDTFDEYWQAYGKGVEDSTLTVLGIASTVWDAARKETGAPTVTNDEPPTLYFIKKAVFNEYVTLVDGEFKWGVNFDKAHKFTKEEADTYLAGWNANNPFPRTAIATPFTESLFITNDEPQVYGECFVIRCMADGEYFKSVGSNMTWVKSLDEATLLNGKDAIQLLWQTNKHKPIAVMETYIHKKKSLDLSEEPKEMQIRWAVKEGGSFAQQYIDGEWRDVPTV